MNMLFRRAQEHDAHAIYELAAHSGIGLTTLPKDRDLLNQRLALSTSSFNKKITAPEREYYLFVLEDALLGKIVGTAAIEALTGVDTPFYSYQYISSPKTCSSLSLQSQHDYLKLTYNNQHRTEVCTLYLEPSYRRNGNGILLSLARFLFIASHPERFAPLVIAEMRGVSDEQGHSPFWDAAGSPFFGMSFREADQLTLFNKQFIADLIPEHPIYLACLPPEARKVIGQPHPSTQPAMNILLREGFTYNQTVDIFDAGPTLEVKRDNIRTVTASQRMSLHITDTPLQQEQRVLLANTSLHFRATLGSAQLDFSHHKCTLHADTARLLNLKDDDEIIISTI